MKHTFNRECPACNGFCKFIEVGGAIPYEEIEAEILRRRRLASLAPMFEKTEAGDQAVIPGAEGRSIPDKKLKPKKQQRDTPTALEAGEIDSKQERLF